MSDARPPMDDAPYEEAQVPQPARSRPSMFRDPVVRRMSYAAALVVLLFLATIVGVLTTGALSPSGPRTLAEKELVVTRAAVEAGSTDPADWNAYITALVADRQYSRARGVITDARRSVEDSATGDISIAEARLLRAQNDGDRVIEVLDAAMDEMVAVHEERLTADSITARAARVEGLPQNYYTAALLKADVYVDRGEWEMVIEQYDIYIERHRGAADILIDRANAKIEIGDTQGAEEDFRAALRFTPNDAEALEGLDRIGATR